jgi:hypothetical protein
VILGAAFVSGYGFGWARLRSAQAAPIVLGATDEGEEFPAEPPQPPSLAHE